MMWTDLKELYRFRDLLMSLAIRDIKVRYRQTLLGVAWALLQPLAFMAIFTLVFAKFGKVSSDGTPYPVFSYAGLLPWIFFATALTLSGTSIMNHMSMVKKMYFPREVFPLSITLACFVDFLVAAALFVGLAFLFHVPVTWHWVWLLWPIAIEVMLIIGLGLLTSATNVFFRDIKYIVPVAIQLGMFVCPVIYSVTAIPEHLRPWYLLNPMAVVIDSFRHVTLHNHFPDMGHLWLGTGIAAVGLVLSYIFFKHIEGQFADVI